MPKHTFRGGVHPMRKEHEGKRATSNLPIQDFVSDKVVIPMGMHLGAPSAPCVKKGDYVKLGQMIAEPVGALGIPVHASVSGEVIDIGALPYVVAESVACITIQNDFQDTWVDELPILGDVEKLDPKLVVPAIKNAGICGLGGASFPTHIKLSIPKDKTCDIIILNGAECETFLTADDRLMREQSGRIVDGLRAAMRALDVKKGVIAIEENKPEAIAKMQEAAQGRQGVEIAVLKTKYPQGGEKMLIKAVTGREVPSLKLPIEIGVLVLNVATAAAIADALIEGKPLVSRITTVTGHVNEPKNLRLRIGTLVKDIIEECGGYAQEPGKLALGGGMTGICMPNDDVPMTKATNGIVVYNKEEAKALEEGSCIRCGRCVEVCPMGLSPYLMKYDCDKLDIESAREKNVEDCCLCGTCSYACPANRWLTASFKNVKDKIALAQRKGNAK